MNFLNTISPKKHVKMFLRKPIDLELAALQAEIEQWLSELKGTVTNLSSVCDPNGLLVVTFLWQEPYEPMPMQPFPYLQYAVPNNPLTRFSFEEEQRQVAKEESIREQLRQQAEQELVGVGGSGDASYNEGMEMGGGGTIDLGTTSVPAENTNIGVVAERDPRAMHRYLVDCLQDGDSLDVDHLVRAFLTRFGRRRRYATNRLLQLRAAVVEAANKIMEEVEH